MGRASLAPFTFDHQQIKSRYLIFDKTTLRNIPPPSLPLITLPLGYHVVQFNLLKRAGEVLIVIALLLCATESFKALCTIVYRTQGAHFHHQPNIFTLTLDYKHWSSFGPKILESRCHSNTLLLNSMGCVLSGSSS